MDLIKSFKSNSLVHLLLAFTFIASGLIVNILQICTMVLWWMNAKDLYRSFNIRLAYFYWAMVPFLAEWWANMKVNIYMDKEDFAEVNKENAIVILNHKYDVDWIVGWVIGDRVKILGNAKCMAKKSLSYLPLFGWSWRFCEWIFVQRNLEKDTKTVLPALQNLGEFNSPYWMLLFCEGTRYTEEKHANSVAYANKVGLEPLKHHLLPRSGGFNMVVNGLQNSAAAVYDCTLCIPNKKPTLLDLLNGKSFEVEFIVRRIPLKNVPIDPEPCAKFLNNMYKEKDEAFEHCLNHGKFPTGEDAPQYFKSAVKMNDICVRRSECWWISLMWLTITVGSLFYYFFTLLVNHHWYQISIMIIIMYSVSFLFRKMLAEGAVTQSSSNYGSKKKN